MICATIKKFADADRRRQTDADGKTHRHRSSNSSLDDEYVLLLCRNQKIKKTPNYDMPYPSESKKKYFGVLFYVFKNIVILHYKLLLKDFRN